MIVILCKFLSFLSHLELGTVLSSNLPSLDDHIKSYLLSQSDMTFSTAVKIILRSSITPELIVQLNGLKEYLNISSYEVFYKCYTRNRNESDRY